jgi:glycerophosphoryl diester phosphodiesterase
MRVGIKLFFVWCLLCAGESVAQYIPRFDVQAYRGARHLKPENTVDSFITALEQGATTLVLDVYVSRDRQVVVSAEPWISSACRHPEGNPVTQKEQNNLLLYAMPYDSIRLYACGTKADSNSPEPSLCCGIKPLLRDVLVTVENHIKNYTQYEVDYVITFNTEPKHDDAWYPLLPEFCERVFQELDAYIPMNRVVVQSPDIRVLQHWHQNHPMIRLSLKSTGKGTISGELNTLGFNPADLCIAPGRINGEVVRFLHQRKVRVIAWNVQESNDMQRLKSLGVDGIITDYPERAMNLGFGSKRTAQKSGARR